MTISSNINKAIKKYPFTILGSIAGGLLFGNIIGVLLLALVGFIIDSFNN